MTLLGVLILFFGHIEHINLFSKCTLLVGLGYMNSGFRSMIREKYWTDFYGSSFWSAHIVCLSIYLPLLWIFWTTGFDVSYLIGWPILGCRVSNFYWSNRSFTWTEIRWKSTVFGTTSLWTTILFSLGFFFRIYLLTSSITYAKLSSISFYLFIREFTCCFFLKVEECDQ